MIPLAPIYLIGLLAAGIPVLLHLIFRRQAHKVLFSTIRFLRLSNERTRHRRRVQDLLLLLLRTALLIALALALAQFIVKLTGGTGMFRARAQVAIVVDNSYSMQVQQEGRSRYDAAKEAALEILRGLQPEDQVAVLFTSGPERRTEPKFSADLQDVQSAIDRSTASAEGGDVMLAVRDAQRLLAAQKAGPKEIYVLTDLQKLAWQAARSTSLDEPAETALTIEERANIPVIVYDAGQPVTGNLAAREIRVSGQAFVKGAPVTVDADIMNPSPQPASALVSLFVSGELRAKRKLDIGPTGIATASFTYELPAPGITAVQVRLPDDPLAVDNERSYKLEVKDKIRALIVQDAASAVNFLDQSYFLERALDPSIVLGGASASIIRPERILLKNLTPARLSGCDVLFLLNVRTVPDNTAAALKQFVKNGGGLIIFAGEDVDAAEYARLFAQPPDPLLPLPLLPVDRTPPDRRNSVAVTSLDESHPVFAPFRGLNILKAVRVYKSARVDLHASTPMATLAHLADGQPLLLTHPCGKGKTAFITVPADGSWSNLPLTDMFLPMIHQLVHYVCGTRGEQDSLTVGAPYRFSFPDATARVDIDVRRPDGAEETISTAPAHDGNDAVYAKTFTPGVYSYSTRGGLTRQGAFVVNPDTTESNLERATGRELETALEPAVVRMCSNLDDMQKLIAPLREGVHLRDLFIFVAIIVALFETIISNWTAPSAQPEKRHALAPAGSEASDA